MLYMYNTKLFFVYLIPFAAIINHIGVAKIPPVLRRKCQKLQAAFEARSGWHVHVVSVMPRTWQSARDLLPMRSAPVMKLWRRMV